eukprot:2331750-Pyramimonas_sp.AAC.1
MSSEWNKLMDYTQSTADWPPRPLGRVQQVRRCRRALARRPCVLRAPPTSGVSCASAEVARCVPTPLAFP